MSNQIDHLLPSHTTRPDPTTNLRRKLISRSLVINYSLGRPSAILTLLLPLARYHSRSQLRSPIRLRLSGINLPLTNSFQRNLLTIEVILPPSLSLPPPPTRTNHLHPSIAISTFSQFSINTLLRQRSTTLLPLTLRIPLPPLSPTPRTSFLR